MAKQRADIKIRMTEKLRSKIEVSAADAGISMNEEMVRRLAASYSTNERQLLELFKYI